MYDITTLLWMWGCMILENSTALFNFENLDRQPRSELYIGVIPINIRHLDELSTAIISNNLNYKCRVINDPYLYKVFNFCIKNCYNYCYVQGWIHFKRYLYNCAAGEKLKCHIFLFIRSALLHWIHLKLGKDDIKILI